MAAEAEGPAPGPAFVLHAPRFLPISPQEDMEASTLPSVAGSTPIGRAPRWDRVLLGLLGVTAALAVALDSEAGGRSVTAALFACTLASALALIPRAFRPGFDGASRAAAIGLAVAAGAGAAAGVPPS